MAKYALRAAKTFQRSLQVQWEDGFVGNFPYVWMRDNTWNRPSLLHLSIYQQPMGIESDPQGVTIAWQMLDRENYSSEFLRHHATIKPVTPVECPITQQKVLTVPWRVMPHFPSAEAFQKGAIAELQWGEYYKEPGTVWPQMERIPSLVTVEAVTPDAKVSLVDGVQALNLMAEKHPEEFAFLSTAPIDYESDMFHASHPTATMHNGKVAAATFNNDQRSAEITTDSLDWYYHCLKTYHAVMLPLRHTIQLDLGQVLVVDNHQCFIGAPAQYKRQLRVSVFN